MSGTSLDGLDIAAVEFKLSDGKWKFTLVAATTVGYTANWKAHLSGAPELSGEKLSELHVNYGRYIGEQVKLFLDIHNLTPDLVASHGHTVFHQPEKGYTLQIGSGSAIAAQTGLLTVADFRSADVALGGQGAPLVPIGDKYLFSDYEYCLNLGGFGNISFEENGKRLAYDTCPVNIVLNYFAAKNGLAFDENGNLGRKGKIITELLTQLNELPFYKSQAPKSLGREWVEDTFLPLLTRFNGSDADKIRTVYEHIALQISKAVSRSGKMLLTGGGAFNSFLVERIKAHSTCELCIPEPSIIDFKEALIFAFLGVLRVRKSNNCLSSVTGATKDSCGGVVFHP